MRLMPYVLFWESKLFAHHAINRLFRYAGLESDQYAITSNSKQLLELAIRKPYVDVIFIGLGASKEAAYMLLKYLRAVDQLRRTHIVAVSEHIGIGEMRRAQQTGFDGFMIKPTDAKAFSTQLRQLLEGKPLWEYE